MFKKMQNRKGFTLIEMMAVIAIVAVLVAVIVPTVSKAQMKAKGAADAANLRNISASIATRYVTTTDSDELKEGLEAPVSKVRESPLVLVYEYDKQMYSYFADSLIGNQNLRGLPYNGYVAEAGELPENYDTATGTLICVLGSGEYAGKDLTEILMSDFQKYVTGEIENARNNVISDQEYYDQLMDAYVNGLEEEAFKAQFEKTFTDNVPYKSETKGWGPFSYTEDWYDLDGDGEKDYYNPSEVHASKSAADDALKNYAESLANNAWTNQSTSSNNAAAQGALTAAQQAATNAGQNYNEEEAKKVVDQQVQDAADAAGTLAGIGATVDGLGDALGVLGSTTEGQQAQKDFEDWLNSNFGQ